MLNPSLKRGNILGTCGVHRPTVLFLGGGFGGRGWGDEQEKGVFD